MKTTIKFILVLGIMALGFYNLEISKSFNANTNFELVTNVASADSENGGGGTRVKDVVAVTGTGLRSVTQPNGQVNTVYFKFTKVDCMGTGNIVCTSSYSETIIPNPNPQ